VPATERDLDVRRVRTAALGYCTGVLLLAAALAHAFAGWPPLRAALDAQGVGPDIAGALAAGWLFGSAAMCAFGLVLMAMARDVRRGVLGSTAPAWVVAAAFGAFGFVAWVLRDFNPHFLAFIAMGALVAAFAAAARRGRP
jgi:hypothetical protein